MPSYLTTDLEVIFLISAGVGLGVALEALKSVRQQRWLQEGRLPAMDVISPRLGGAFTLKSSDNLDKLWGWSGAELG